MKGIEKRISIINRIKLIFKGLNNRKIAQILNTSAVSVGRWFNDKAIPPYNVLIEIANYGGVTLDWLLTGKELTKAFDISMLRENGVFYKSTANVIIRTEDEFRSHLKELEAKKCYIPVPLIPHSVAARDPIDIKDKDIEEFFLIQQNWLRKEHIYRCIRVIENSMSPILEENFIVVIDCSINEPRQLEGKIIAARYKDSITIKKLLLTNEYYILQSQNTLKYQPMKIPLQQSNIVIGKVIYWWGHSKY